MPTRRFRLSHALIVCGWLIAADTAAQSKPTVTPADYAKWESLAVTELSPDGKWLAFVIDREDADGDLRIRRIGDDSTRVIPNASRPAFSADSRWLAYSIGVSEAERERLEQAGQPVRSKVALLDLQTGVTAVIDRIAMFEFSGDGRYISLRSYSAPNRSSQGVDLIVRDLARGINTNIGNVATSAWQPHGALLALGIDAEQSAANGIRLYDAAAATLRSLHTDTAQFTGLAWRDDGADLAVLQVHKHEQFDEPTHNILLWRNVSRPAPLKLTFTHLSRAGFPADYRITDARELSWSKDGRTLFFGSRPWTRKATAAKPDSAKANVPVKAQERAGVDIWHADDVDIIPEQKMRANLESNRSLPVAWQLDTDRMVSLSTQLAEDVSLSEGRYALTSDGTAYDRDRMFGPAYRDLYVVDVNTGERTRVVERVQYTFGISTTGRYVLYARDDHYWVFDVRTRRHTNLTKSIATSFINLDDDHTIQEKPPYGTGGWSADETRVLLHDKYDVWAVRLDGSGGDNLTSGAAQRIRHRRVWLNPDDRIVDLAKPFYVLLYGDRTKQAGYGRVLPRGGIERLLYVDKTVTRLTRADSADVYMYRIEGADDSPDVFVGGPRLDDATQVSHTNPFQQDYAWTRGELIDYRNTSGRDLQAALLYPANYTPGRKYPMIVYLYDITSNTLHNYHVPSERVAYNPAVFTQNGYFVLRPDIVYRGRNPGLSAVEALLPAVDRVLETGMVDSARVGIVGHSWGAYQTAFTVTQTNRFAAAVAGAPLTNLISMYLSIYWNTGGTDARIFEIQQGRMEVPFWEDLDAYMKNSPLFSVRALNTPLLVAFGDRDGAVDWHQGIELYNAARRADKDVVMLVYEGENHSLAREANQRDYHRRINEWFGHYLKGDPAPEWITSGIKHIARDRELERLRR